jgi:hypothetical protein
MKVAMAVAKRMKVAMVVTKIEMRKWKAVQVIAAQELDSVTQNKLVRSL